MNTQQKYPDNQQEDEKLQLENVQLKKRLEKEEFLHKTLYNQWNELNARMLSTERELQQSRSRNSFYKYGFYLILFLLIPAYYFLNSRSGEQRNASTSQIISSPAATVSQATTESQATPNQLTSNETTKNQAVPNEAIPNETTTNKVISNNTITNGDKVHLHNANIEKENIPKPQQSVINKPASAKEFTDSARDLIYSEGWDAYYEKSGNPYQKSSQKYKVWLEGWKDAQNDDKKMLTRGVSDTGENDKKN